MVCIEAFLVQLCSGGVVPGSVAREGWWSELKSGSASEVRRTGDADYLKEVSLFIVKLEREECVRAASWKVDGRGAEP